MKKALVVAVVFLFAWACTQTEGPASVGGEKSEIKMGEFSELALLMKEIHEDAKGWRSKLVAGELVTDTVAIYEAMVTSTPTKPEVKGSVFEGFAANYQEKLDAFLSAKNANLASGAYNNLVKACVACHRSYCPGPIPTIEKLYVPEP